MQDYLIPSSCQNIDHRVEFNLNLGIYQNIITFLTDHDILFLAEMKLDFTKIPLELHGNGDSYNLLKYLENNNMDSDLIFKFLNYFLSIMDIEYSCKFMPLLDNQDPKNVIFFDFIKTTQWQNINLYVYIKFRSTTTTTTTLATNELLLAFNDIANAELMISGSSSDVSLWNTFFDLPLNGTPFSSLIISGNTIKLFGGHNIFLKNSLFDNNYSNSLLSIIDSDCITSGGTDVFGGNVAYGCPNLTTIRLPKIIEADDYCFYNCTSLINLYLPLLKTAGYECFANSNLVSINLPSLMYAGDYCFYNCTKVVTYNLPILVTAGSGCFANSISVLEFNLPELLSAGAGCFQLYYMGVAYIANLPLVTFIGDYCFYGWSSGALHGESGRSDITTFYLPSCTNLGSTTGDNSIFTYVSNIVNLTIPVALMSCNNGSPDGDILFLQTQATVNITVIGTLTYDLLLIYTDNSAHTNCDMMIGGDSTLLSSWNTFFNLPTNGNPFTSLEVNGDTFNLIGGSNIILRNNLFNENQYSRYLTHFLDNSNCIIAAGTSVFSNPSGSYELLIVDLPALISADDNCFSDVYSVSKFNLPLLETAGNNCFYHKSRIREFNLPSLTHIGDGGFSKCDDMINLNLPVCTNLGSTTGDNSVFSGVTSLKINLTIPEILMICNSGLPDGDIITLFNNNTVIHTNVLSLNLVFDDISNADLMIGVEGGSSNVSLWNTFFNLPTNGSVFSSVVVDGNLVKLYGGSNVHLKDSLFDNSYSQSLLSIIDTTNCIISAGTDVFGWDNNNGCPNLSMIYLPSLTTAGTSCFSYCSSVISFNFPALITAGDSCFSFCSSATTFNLPSLITAGDNCFYLCSLVTSFNLPSLTTAGSYCFFNCSLITTFSLNSLLTAGDHCFAICSSVSTFTLNLTTAGNNCFLNCTSVTYFSLSSLVDIGDSCFNNCSSVSTIIIPSCVHLGTTVLDNNVFLNISGRSIQLSIPLALMTCNSGNRDGDITYLQAYNTVSITTY